MPDVRSGPGVNNSCDEDALIGKLFAYAKSDINCDPIKQIKNIASANKGRAAV